MTLKRVGDRPIQYQADTHSNLLDQAVFTVRSVNEAVWDGANQPVTAVLSNYELLFLLEGEAAFTQKDYHSDARTGDVVLLSPFTPYTVCPVEGQPLRCLSIHFLLSPSYMERVFDGMFHSKSGLAVKPSDPQCHPYAHADAPGELERGLRQCTGLWPGQCCMPCCPRWQMNPLIPRRNPMPIPGPRQTSSTGQCVWQRKDWQVRCASRAWYGIWA